jgi:hypothetical protein
MKCNTWKKKTSFVIVTKPDKFKSFTRKKKFSIIFHKITKNEVKYVEIIPLFLIFTKKIE